MLLLCLVTALSGCAGVRMMGDYDERIDTGVTAVQRKMERFLVSIERQAGQPAARFENHAAFYDDIREDLSALRVRAAAHANNEITVQQIQLLADNVSTLEKLDRIGLTPEQIPLLRNSFNAACTALLRLELAKRRN